MSPAPPRRRRKAPNAEPPALASERLTITSELVERARQVAFRHRQLDQAYGEMTASRDAMSREAHQAQLREAVTRTELTLALHAALSAREAEADRLRTAVLRNYVAEGIALRRHGRPSRALDRFLARLGSFGQALIIARSRTWRGTGRGLHDLRHMAAYVRRGARPDVSPPAFVDQRWYLEQNPDVARGRTAPLVHYLLMGSLEGRSIHPLLHEASYRAANYADIAATGLSALEHYDRRGARQGRSPHPAFDVAHYLAQGPVLAPGEDALSNYLREGGRRGLSPHPLFDPVWYADQTGETEAGALLHYLTIGWRAGLSPHPLFDGVWYLEQNLDVAREGQEPLTHFLLSGAQEGRSPSPWFDLPHYVEARGAALAPGLNPLVDYLRGGAWAVAEARPGFPTAAYLASRPELVAQGMTPLEHWARLGGR